MPQVRANEIDIEYESFGRETDPLILLIMGFGAHLLFWPETLCEGLAAKGFCVVRFDNRDIGKSTHLASESAPDPRALFAEVMAGKRPQVPYTLDDMADDAVGLMDALGAGRAHIVGASMGGMIAQLVAINHPGRMKSLISIMSTTGRRDLPSGNPETLSVLFRPPNSTSRDDLIDASILVQKALSGPGFPSNEAEMRARAERRTGLRAFRYGRRRASVGGFDRRRAAKRALERGALPRARAARRGRSGDPGGGRQGYRRSIPGAELVIIPGMGHDFPSALAPVYLKQIGNFVARVEARSV